MSLADACVVSMVGIYCGTRVGQPFESMPLNGKV